MPKKHIHKYHRVTINSRPHWACALPDCGHYMPFHISNMVIGKKSYCWECDKVFILDEMNMKDDRPICNECANPEIVDFVASQSSK